MSNAIGSLDFSSLIGSIDFSALSVEEKNSLYALSSGLAEYEIQQKKGLLLTKADDAIEMVRQKLMGLDYEVFGALWLCSQHSLIAHENLFSGTLAATSVYPREVVKSALKHQCGAVIFYHNHPSGLTSPSQSDINITKKLKDALSLVDVVVLDHIVVGKEGTSSMASLGLV